MTAKDSDKQDQSGQDEEGVFDPNVAFPPIGEEVDNAAPAEKPAAEADPVEERLAAIEQRFEAEKAQWAERERRQQETIDRLIQGQVAGSAQAPQQAPPDPYDMSDLPDPVDNPKEFKTEMAAKMRRLDEYRKEQAQQQQSQSSGMDVLWTKFQETNPDLANRTSHIQGAVSMEVAELKQRGLDPQKAALSDPDGFVSRVANRMRKELGSEGSPSGTDQSTITGKPNRTAGVSAGSHDTKPKGNKGGEGKDFLSQMKEFQLSDGII